MASSRKGFFRQTGTYNVGCNYTFNQCYYKAQGHARNGASSDLELIFFSQNLNDYIQTLYMSGNFNLFDFRHFSTIKAQWLAMLALK